MLYISQENDIANYQFLVDFKKVCLMKNFENWCTVILKKILKFTKANVQKFNTCSDGDDVVVIE